MKVALVGNQNSGKTTLFNYLTGMNAKIGNWPGVTIEKKTGNIKGTNYEITDLPGIYSLSPYTLEEDAFRLKDCCYKFPLFRLSQRLRYRKNSNCLPSRHF